MYIVRRHHKFWAFHDIPPSISGINGLPKKRFSAKLNTDDRAVAAIRAASLKAQWLSEIKRAKAGTYSEEDDVLNSYHYTIADTEGVVAAFKAAYRRASLDERKKLLSAATNVAEDVAYGIDGVPFYHDDPDDPSDERPGVQAGGRILHAATGGLIGLTDYLDEYLATLKNKNETKSVDLKKASINKFAVKFPYIADVQRKAVQEWVNAQDANGSALATIRRFLSELRGYWAYLQSINVAPEDYNPFEKLSLAKAGKDAKANARRPFAPDDLVKLLAVARSDAQLADLIMFGMWTGARIEEMCALKVKNVHLEKGYIDITDAKTSAGWRQVPIHSKLMPTLRRLVESSNDGYVLSGLLRNKYGDRSGAVGKRFGRLKTKQGFGPQYVFHCIRKTVATMLENAGVQEGIAADILGHEKQTITYGLYSGGTSLELKQDAIEKLDYSVRRLEQQA